MSFSFSKYSGLGNDFIFVDHRTSFFPIQKAYIQSLCHRHQGIGADGIILVEESEIADFKMRIFNSDGSEAEMCGNAIRCLYLFLHEIGKPQEQYQIEVYNRVLPLYKKGELIGCAMGEVSEIKWEIPILFNELLLKGHFLNTGVPHFVVPTRDLHQIPVLPLGHFICHHPEFQPAGTNVNFIQLNAQKEIEIRTFERGVNNETKACGTGAAAAAIVGHVLFNLTFPIQVKTLNQDMLSFNFDYKDNKVSNLEMIGPAQKIFEGKAFLPICV